MQTRAAGQYIKHFQYGCGIITEADPSRTTIDFDLHGIKKFVTSLIVVEPAEGVAPKRRRAKRAKTAKTVSALASPAIVPGVK